MVLQGHFIVGLLCSLESAGGGCHFSLDAACCSSDCKWFLTLLCFFFFFLPPLFNFLTILFKQQVEKSLELKLLSSAAGFEHSIKENTLNFLVLPSGIKNQCIPCTV